MIGVTTVPIAHAPVDWFAIAPDLALFGAAIAIVMLRSVVRHDPRVHRASMLIAIAGVATSAVFTGVQWGFVHGNGPYEALSGLVAVDGFAVFVESVILGATLLALLLSAGYLRRENLESPEYFALMLCSATGMMLMASANDLITVFLSLEILSIALYVLAAFDRQRLTSQEAGLKYFLLGSFSSAVFLYGIALTYGATGTTNLTGIAQFLARTVLLHDGVLFIGFALLLVGLGFKVAAAPFHMWAPDVYQGAPTPVTAFMAAATKAAAFAALLRIFVGAFQLYDADWRPAVFALAVLSLLVGSIAAIVQTDVKRMLAYQSVSHAGYVLIGVQAATAKGTSAALFYVCTYAVMATGAFAIVMLVAPARRRPPRAHRLSRPRLGPTGVGWAAHVVRARPGGSALHRRLRRQALGVQRRDRCRSILARTRRDARGGDRRVRLSPHRARDVRTTRRRGRAGGPPDRRRRRHRDRAHDRRGRDRLPRCGAGHRLRLRPRRHPAPRPLTEHSPNGPWAVGRKSRSHTRFPCQQLVGERAPRPFSMPTSACRGLRECDELFEARGRRHDARRNAVRRAADLDVVVLDDQQRTAVRGPRERP